jgi:hypothetical protein
MKDADAETGPFRTKVPVEQLGEAGHVADALRGTQRWADVEGTSSCSNHRKMRRVGLLATSDPPNGSRDRVPRCTLAQRGRSADGDTRAKGRAPGGGRDGRRHRGTEGEGATGRGGVGITVKI